MAEFRGAIELEIPIETVLQGASYFNNFARALGPRARQFGEFYPQARSGEYGREVQLPTVHFTGLPRRTAMTHELAKSSEYGEARITKFDWPPSHALRRSRFFLKRDPGASVV
jgi:hypothetical protein